MMDPITKAAAPKSKTRLFIVDDHPTLRQGVAYLIRQQPDMELIGQAEDVPTARMMLAAVHPDLVVVDLSLKQGSGFDLIREIRASWPGLPILVFSMHDEMLYAQRCMTAGANGYLMKEEPPEQIVQAIRTIIAGSVYLSEKVKQQALNVAFSKGGATLSNPIEKLTLRELEIFRLIGQACSTKQIAKRLGISVKTVELHRIHIKTKLQARSFIELVRLAVQWVEKNP